MARKRKKLGEILLEWGTVTESQIGQAMGMAKGTGKRLGEALIEAGFCKEEEVAKALAAQFESWSLPLAIILIVPLVILSALVGVMTRGMDNNIFTQIGLVVLVGLASKNAILIVEFAKQLEDQGHSLVDAAVEACRLRLRPILMTSFAFILGVVPLAFASGAGSEMRRALGTAVFSGMIGVTLFGLFLTPVFYFVLRKLTGRRKKVDEEEHAVIETPVEPAP